MTGAKNSSHRAAAAALLGVIFLFGFGLARSQLSHRPSGELRSIPRIEIRPTPERKIALERVGGFALPHPVNRLRIQGDALYAAANYDGLRVFDISDPARPRQAHHLSGLKDADEADAHVIVDVFPEGDRMMAFDRLHGLGLYDLSDPLRPRLIRRHPLPEAWDSNTYPISATRVGDRYYLASGGGGLWMLPADFGPDAEPKPLLEHYDYTRSSVFYPPHWLLVADTYDTGLQVLDISEPDRPRLAHQFQTGSFTDAVAPIGEYVALANRSFGITVLDMHDPARPFIANYHYTPLRERFMVKDIELWRGRFLFVVGNFASGGFLHIYDMADPARPVFDQMRQFEDNISTLAFADGVLYLGFWKANRVGIFSVRMREN